MIPLITDAAAAPEVVSVLDRVSAALTTDTLRVMVARVEVDKADPAQVARDFLVEQGLAQLAAYLIALRRSAWDHVRQLLARA